jgi:hypothetical protein
VTVEQYHPTIFIEMMGCTIGEVSRKARTNKADELKVTLIEDISTFSGNAIR